MITADTDPTHPGPTHPGPSGPTNPPPPPRLAVKLTAAQIDMLRYFADPAGCRQWPPRRNPSHTRKALERRGLLEDTYSWPYTGVTEAGRRLISGTR